MSFTIMCDGCGSDHKRVDIHEKSVVITCLHCDDMEELS